MNIEEARRLVGGFAQASRTGDSQAVALLGYQLIEALTAQPQVIKTGHDSVESLSPIYCPHHGEDHVLNAVRAVRVIAALQLELRQAAAGYADIEEADVREHYVGRAKSEISTAQCVREMLALADDSECYRENVDAVCSDSAMYWAEGYGR